MATNQQVKCIAIEEIGAPLKLMEISLPEVGPRDIVVRVEAVSINPIDYKQKDLGFFIPSVSAQNPRVLGYDAAGVVVQVGSKTSLFKVGDEVMYAGDAFRQGSNSTLQVVDERLVGKKPTNLNWSQAASLPLVSLTAYEALVEELGISEKTPEQNKNKFILIVGGAGGVGSTAIQIAKKILNLQVIATASRPETIDYCIKNGADIVINHNNSLIEELKVHNINNVDYIFNTADTTASYFDQFTALIKPFGGIVGISGFLEPVNMFPLFCKRVKVSIELMFARAIEQIDLEKQHHILNKISSEIQNRNLHHNAEIIMEFNLENLNEGMKSCKGGKNIGKIAFSDVQKFFSN